VVPIGTVGETAGEELLIYVYEGVDRSIEIGAKRGEQTDERQQSAEPVDAESNGAEGGFDLPGSQTLRIVLIR
jgi:hypothetical protein